MRMGFNEKGPRKSARYFLGLPPDLIEQIGDEIRPGVPPAEHRCPNLDIRESTVQRVRI
jgi:hypothetical protein